MITLKPFTNFDWQGLAGATRFEDGSEPLLGEAKVGEYEAMVVLDGEGLFVSVMTEEGDEVVAYRWDYPAAARAVALLQPHMTCEQLEASPGVEKIEY